ncbi:MAG: sugar ABC transporter permease [Candidatus Infernicultor aquiphilus]|uniref:sn-glycerol-3-phosphate transport system permease protein UgpA n=1 Tax=Candidatus Infernicultor aquiphilus TaxID=1805029 RepID=A0A1J5GHK4_9BACT|nr:sugar ABC transporter permease [bacterium]OIP72277.1 MAG: glycerol-3-phosphate ABC transporter permease [Candidatus Atribacteria bacterium CG2_30_33_13]PIW11690.1 MAG: sugar ABC transporter permease [Candidatus Atribacteria bacterium CG17_big_fil_post_rev_8_21_14_2_50_34_11]PIY32085.1 MAG: sugar ABC transporter permease [Candidatus Atribacteria bacterium CG_4_10_14_3_um_filter_34_13]PJB56886.1 MAG: sugar ABC transporter permease [Candidatus Atribacteria bacterium CG_4_9_14_3_um_filter_33_16]
MQEDRFPGHKFLPYLLIAPSIAVIIVFLIGPFVQSIRESLFVSTPFGTKTIYVGLRNYVRLFSSPDYRSSVIATFKFSAFVIIGGLSISLAIAQLLNQKIKGVGFYQVALIWTYAISPTVAGVIWASMFAPATGLIPYIVSKLSGGYTLNWMTNGNIALFVVATAATWKMLGYNIIFFLAGLQNVPDEFLEAAQMDGAGSWKAFWRITFPMLSPTTSFLLFVNMLYAFFQVFGLIDIMTRGGPGNATELLVYKLYRDGFIHLNTGFASAQSLIIFLVISVVAIIQLRIVTQKAIYSR